MTTFRFRALISPGPAAHDSQAWEIFATGQHFTLWNGHDIGTGVICRQVYTTDSPS